MDYDNEARGQRETLLSTLLSVLAASGFLFIFFLICGGLSFYILAVLGGVALVGFGHYLLWGHSFSEQVAGEREEEEVRDRLEEDDWPPEQTYRADHRF